MPVHCIPNAGLPINDGGRTLYPMKPDPMAETLREFVLDFGVNIVGGCCGTTPDHIRALVRAIGIGTKPKARPGRSRWFVSSGMTAVALEQEPRPLLIGERLNTQGSRRIKRLALESDYEAMLPIARDQVEGGAHVLDVCMALTERTDEAAHDAHAGQEALAQRRGAAVRRLDRGERHRGGAAGLPGLGDRQLDQPGERPGAHRGGDAAGRTLRRRGDRADDRRDGHGQDGRAQARRGAPHPRHRDRRVWPARRAADLR